MTLERISGVDLINNTSDTEVQRILTFTPHQDIALRFRRSFIGWSHASRHKSLHSLRSVDMLRKRSVLSKRPSKSAPVDSSVDGCTAVFDDTDAMIRAHRYRKQLPVPAAVADFSMRSMAKQFLGKDLSKMSMPIAICEPLTWLQKVAECMEYCDLLETAACSDCPVTRMELVCAFIVASLSSAYKRMNKPFNPLLGETYEYVRPDLSFRFVAEQVSHHPPVSAFHAEGCGYCLWGTLQPNIRFTGRAVECTPLGNVHVFLKAHKETYSWKHVECYVRNILFGKMWVENKGVVEVHCKDNNTKGVLNFKDCDWSGDHHHVEGFVYDGNVAKSALYGSWVKILCSSGVAEYETFLADKSRKSAYTAKKKSSRRKSTDGRCLRLSHSVTSFNLLLPEQKILWKTTPRPATSTQYYMMSRFAMTLNEFLPDHDTILPATDSRLREDIRLMEEGHLDQATEARARLEDQRKSARKLSVNHGLDQMPRWFTSTTDSDDHQTWEFTNTYWERDWDRCPTHSESIAVYMCRALNTELCTGKGSNSGIS